MRIFLRAFFFTCLMVITFLIFILNSYVSPPPLHAINIIFIFLLLFLIWTESGWVVWASFFFHLLLELFTQVPFGITLFSGTLAALLSYWLHLFIFTNRSWYSMALLCMISLLIYRFSYVSLLLVQALLADVTVASRSLTYFIFMEISLTSIVFTGIYISIMRRSFYLRPDRVR